MLRTEEVDGGRATMQWSNAANLKASGTMHCIGRSSIHMFW